MKMSYAIGLGARRGVDATTLVDLVRRVVDNLGVSLADSTLYTIESKASEPGFQEAARQLGLPLTYLPLGSLKKRRSASKTHSQRVQAMFGVGSVSETAALVGAGPGSQLMAPRQSTPLAACAVAVMAPPLAETGR